MSTDKLVFKSNSADKAPGRGVHEVIGNPDDYRTLAAIDDFRRYLSNFDCSAPFTWKWPGGDRSFTFRSIEHAFQAAKMALVDAGAAYRFTVESGDAIGAGDGAVAQKHRKLVKLDDVQLAIWDTMLANVMSSAARAKYTQNRDGVAARVLIATRNAELWHLSTSRGNPSQLVRFAHLESIRAELTA